MRETSRAGWESGRTPVAPSARPPSSNGGASGSLPTGWSAAPARPAPPPLRAPWTSPSKGLPGRTESRFRCCRPPNSLFAPVRASSAAQNVHPDARNTASGDLKKSAVNLPPSPSSNPCSPGEGGRHERELDSGRGGAPAASGGGWRNPCGDRRPVRPGPSGSRLVPGRLRRDHPFRLRGEPGREELQPDADRRGAAVVPGPVGVFSPTTRREDDLLLEPPLDLGDCQGTGRDPDPQPEQDRASVRDGQVRRPGGENLPGPGDARLAGQHDESGRAAQ